MSMIRQVIRRVPPLTRSLFWKKAPDAKEGVSQPSVEQQSNEVLAPVSIDTVNKSAVKYTSQLTDKEVIISNQSESQQVAVSTETDLLKFTILGNETHAAQIELGPGKSVRAEAGSLAFMSEGISMNTNLVGGLSLAFRRILAGSSLMLTDFTYQGAEGSGRVVFSPEHPSKIIPIRLSEHGNHLICAKDSYLCAETDLQLEVEFVKKVGFGFFGGEGFMLQKLTGTGIVLLKGGGVVIQKDLRDGEEIRVSSGNLMAFEKTVLYDLQLVAGFKNVIFGGEGLFLTTLKGPGRVYLQSMPFSRIVSTIMQHLPHK